MILLGLFGYGYFSYGASGVKIVKENPLILPFAIPLILPFLICLLLKFFIVNGNEKKEDYQKKTTHEYLLSYGEIIKIDFTKSINEIRELDVENNIDFEIIKELLFFPFHNFFVKKNIMKWSSVKIKYKIENKYFYKEFIVPFNKETTGRVLKLNKTTILYYEKDNPVNSIIDLKFIEEFT